MKLNAHSYQYHARPVDFLKYHCLDFNEYQGEIASSTKQSLTRPELIKYYPLANHEPLLPELSNILKAPVQNIALTNGADEALFHTLLMAKMRLNCNRSCIFFNPSYSHAYFFMKTLGFNTIPFQSSKTFQDSKQQIIYISFPNNPTGEEMPPHEFSAQLKRFKKSLWLVDLTYMLYSRYPLNSYIDMILSHNNVVSVMSFSKVFPLAGLRMAFVLSSHPQLLSYFREEYNKKTVNTLARTTAMDCIKNWSFYEKQRKQILNNRKQLACLFEKQALEKNLKVKSMFSTMENRGGNFFCMSGSLKERMLFVEYLYSKKIIVRCKKEWDFLRITSVSDKYLKKIETIFLK